MSTRNRFAAPLAALALTSGLVLAGCQLLTASPTNPTPSPSASAASIPEADLEACEHMNNGTATAITAVQGDVTPPSVSAGHTRYAITLPASNEQYAGKVLYNSSEETDYVLFFDQDVTLTVLDPDQQVVAIEASASSSVACGTVKARYVLPFGVGPHTLQLGPTAASTVSLVIEESAHEEHDHAN